MGVGRGRVFQIQAVELRTFGYVAVWGAERTLVSHDSHRQGEMAYAKGRLCVKRQS